MPKGYLIVTVLVSTTDEPVSGASVTVTGENYEETFTTDENGKTSVIELMCHQESIL